MACSVNHSKVAGLKFCVECGESLAPKVRICADGHELVRENKFCEICGQGENSVGDSTATIRPTRDVTPPPQPQSSFSSELPAYQPPTPSKNNIKIIIAASVSTLLVLLGVVINSNKVTYTDVTVTMNIYDQDCWDLSWGYFDIPNGEVVIKVDGEAIAYGNYQRYGTDTTYACTFSTILYDVPMNGDFYEVGMTSGRRGTITNSQADMEENDWNFTLSLGL